MRVSTLDSTSLDPIIVFRLHDHKGLQGFIEIAAIADSFSVPNGFEKFRHH
jgi:hypothetical protein